METLIVAAVALMLALAAMGGWWLSARKNGAEQEKRKTAEGERDAAIEVAEARGAPLETPEERRASARAELLSRGIRLPEAGDGNG